MILTKDQIKKIEKLHKKANLAEVKARLAESELCVAIIKATGVKGVVDFLQGDGFGFSPESNLDTHIGIDEILKMANDGIDINETLILNNLSF